MSTKNFFDSKIFRGGILGVGIMSIFFLVFHLGVIVGFHKASFSYRWADEYHRNFAGPRGGFMRDTHDRDFIEAHGVVGSIIKIDGSILIIRSKNDVEKNVLVSDSTLIKRFQKKILVGDLTVNDSIIIIGEPKESGQIEAKFIRVLPSRVPSSR